jgi:aerobic carbon-monoxide dehydrogenase large subunit
MSTQVLSAGRFVGQSVARKEDLRLITGKGHYVDDMRLNGMLHAAFLRSDVARGRSPDSTSPRPRRCLACTMCSPART